LKNTILRNLSAKVGTGPSGCQPAEKVDKKWRIDVN
jgi:hypothetical protein